ncbi:cob(I)yrinic acid a,c-diamide adenosyltransferase [Pontiella sp.]|uniref:cob(I)yrinic acid a,c-diamide adenosyltransferase n=1 Tax=Pontiella sp. TaxID=2837462 RepID=UPI0035640012
MPKIFTKTGDKGETGRFDGTRVPKNDPQMEVQGAIDECNSAIGVARAFVEDEQLDAALKNFQSHLLVAGAEVTNAGNDHALPFITKVEIKRMEGLIDDTEAELEPLTHFILPAGGKASAHLHVARAASRKVERRLVTLRQTAPVNPVLLAYFNRLSDALFVLARLAAKRAGHHDEIWTNPRKP